jgi:Leucine-rich repeat (LRR) protein
MFQKLLLSIVILLISTNSFAQSKALLSEEELAEAKVYTNIDKALKKVAEVYILDLSSQGIDKLPKTITRFRSLQKLILTDNQLTEFPPELARMKKLQTIYVDSNQIETLYLNTSDSRSFQNLENLYVGFNPLKSIPENIKNIDLMMVSLAGCKYLDINKVFTPLASINSLEQLDLSYLNLDTIPWEVVNLYGLTTLDLSANPAMEWDTSIAFLSQSKSIEEIILKHNKLVEISENFKKFKNLQALDLSYNDKLSVRQVLDVTKGIEQLHSLNLSHCEIRELPKTIGDQKKIWDLYLQHNRLARVPVELGMLEELETINLSYNDILELPEEFGDLQSLEKIYISNNPLEFLPKDMENLNDLKYIELPKESLGKDIKKVIKKMWPDAEVVYIKDNIDE